MHPDSRPALARPSIHTAEKRFVYHAVHMVFNGDFMEPWAEGEKKMSKLVFIGKNLDAAALRARFDACLATPANLERKLKSLRFAVGEQVASPRAVTVTVTAAVLTLVLTLSLTHALSLGYRRSSARSMARGPQARSRCCCGALRIWSLEQSHPTRLFASPSPAHIRYMQ